MSKTLPTTIKKILKYSFDEIEWDYRYLTETEKLLVTVEEFNKLHAYVLGTTSRWQNYTLKPILGRIFKYMFNSIKWEFQYLTTFEKEILRSDWQEIKAKYKN